MTNPTPPLCKDCTKHTADHHCARLPPMTNSVTGQPFYPSCESERKRTIRDRFLTSMKRCGPEGRFFEKRSGGVEFRWETPPQADGDEGEL